MRLKSHIQCLYEKIRAVSDYTRTYTNNDNSEVVKAIYAFVREYKTQGRQQDAQQKKMLFWNKLTFFGLLAYTVLTFLLWQSARTANQLNEEGGRAWLGTTSASITKPIVKGSGLIASINYGNTGKEPAKETARNTFVQIFSQKQWDNGEAVQRLSSYEQECFKASPSTVHGISFPTSGNNAYEIQIDSNGEDVPETYRTVVTDDLIAGKSFATVSGCIIYITAQRISHTAFCYKYQAGKMSTSALPYCTVGNDAN